MQLSREAERLRRELSEKEQGGQAASDIPSSAPTEASSISSNPSKGPFGYEVSKHVWLKYAKHRQRCFFWQ